MAGSMWAMPIIVINMGGEMIYILQQRLQAQNVPADKAKKVLLDVVKAMYSPLFLSELFKPQEMYTAASTKQIFEKLAHSSIMRLNKSSMDKLYDLMIMGFKYQSVSCTAPQQLLQVTLHHLELILDIVRGDPTEQPVQLAIDNTISTYCALTYGQWILLNQSLMRFFQGKKTKVSLFLQRGLQTMEGNIILTNIGPLPCGTEIPGEVRYYEGKSMISDKRLEIPTADGCIPCNTVFDPNSTLGFNMYAKGDVEMPHSVSLPSVARAAREMGSHLIVADTKKVATSQKGGSSAKDEINLLADLLGMGHGSSKMEADAKPFKINLFPDNMFGDKVSGSKSAMIMIDIDGAAGAKTMTQYMDDLDLKDDPKADRKGGDDDDDDLLALMDSAASKK